MSVYHRFAKPASLSQTREDLLRIGHGPHRRSAPQRVLGYGYEVTSADIIDAFSYTMNAAEKAGCREETLRRVRELLVTETPDSRFVSRILALRLELV